MDVTIGELQEMARRQQQQMASQQQMLVAKEQRLKYLKQQELRHQQVAAESQRVRNLREKVEQQEIKIKRLRALRGHVQQQKSSNSTLGSELEGIKSLFNEKEKELAAAVQRVEELTRQLENLRRERHTTPSDKTSPAALELEKLRAELCMRNKLNEQQNSKLAAHRQVLQQRKEELANMDARIAELQARLTSRRAAAAAQKNTNVAAVEPYVKHMPNNNNITKYQTLPASLKLQSKGHSTAYQAMEDTLKGVDEKTGIFGNYNVNSIMSNFGPRPYGMQYSTSESTVSGNSDLTISFPKTSTPISNGNPSLVDKEIMITSEPSPVENALQVNQSSFDAIYNNNNVSKSQQQSSNEAQPYSNLVTSKEPASSSMIVSSLQNDNLEVVRHGDDSNGQTISSGQSSGFANHQSIGNQGHQKFLVGISRSDESKDNLTAKVLPLNSSSSDSPPPPPVPSSQPPPYPAAPPYNIDPMKYRSNAPKSLRRRASAGEADLNLPSSCSASENAKVEEGTDNAEELVQLDVAEEDISQGEDASDGNVLVVVDSTPVQRPLQPAIKSKSSNDSISSDTRRVRFDPLALLLDASLEGELELVMRTAKMVQDPSTPNDEGITALHNAICAGHFDIVKFLIEFGCNVNSPDNDGWTPLHCAASCNNLKMVKFLVENGACIFATTISDSETAAEKCEEDEDGYDGCSQYLYNVQEKLGIINKGAVYTLFDYRSQKNDELGFECGTKLTVLRKGDDEEKDWWWSSCGSTEGYVPRNLLGLYPRVAPKFPSL